MLKKPQSKLLTNIEQHFAQYNSALQQAVKVFQDLDQLEYELDLLDEEQTTASQYSWWPIVALIGGDSSDLPRFLEQFINLPQTDSSLTAYHPKFTALQYHQDTTVSLPGTALDVDYRLPFYEISKQIDQIAPGEGHNINAYLELKSSDHERLKNRLFIHSPPLNSTSLSDPITRLLTEQVLDIADLVLVFCDVFNHEGVSINQFCQAIAAQQDTDKFVFLVNSQNESLTQVQQKLAQAGVRTGQFISLSSDEALIDEANQAAFEVIKRRVAQVGHYRSYRILHYLELHIQKLQNIVIPEVSDALSTWKERSHFSSALVMSLIIGLLVLIEVNIGGVLDLILDPVIGSIVLLIFIGIMIPVHLALSRFHGKWLINRLENRKKELRLLENLAALFEKNLTPMRMLLPISTPIGWNQSTKRRVAKLLDKTKGLVLILNDNFGVFTPANGSPTTETTTERLKQ